MGYTHASYLRPRGYCAQPPRSKSHGKQAAPLQEGARSTRRGFKVGVIVSLEKSFVRGIKARIACTVAGSKRYGLQHLSDECAISWGIFDGEKITINQFGSGFIILLGVYLVNRSK